MDFIIAPGNISGLPERETAQLIELVDVYNWHQSNNATKDRYYEGKIPVGEVNLGIALPKKLAGLEIGCAWGAKTVDVLAARSMFDGFVDTNGNAIDQLNTIVQENRLIAEYMKACRDELKFGCTFATLSADPEMRNGCRIRFHSPQSGSALWSGEKGRIECGMAIIDSVKDESEKSLWEPSLVNLYTDEAVWTLERDGNRG